jgi:hypothetical protein
MYTQFWWEDLLRSGYFEDLREDGKITLKTDLRDIGCVDGRQMEWTQDCAKWWGF